MKSHLWLSACVVAGSLAAPPAVAQPAAPPSPTQTAPSQPATPLPATSTADAIPRGTTLAAALDAAWQRAVEARQSASQRQRADAERNAADSFWVAPPALELQHRSDRWQSNTGQRETELSAAVPLWQPGQRQARLAAADADIALADAHTAAARLRLAAQVREAAWQWQTAQAEAEAARTQVQYLERLSDDVQRRVRAGDLAPVDALAARAERLDAQTLLAELHQRLAQAQTQWRSLTGLQALPVLATPTPALTGLDTPLSDAHPELLLAALEAERARKQLAVLSTSRRDAPELLLSYRTETPGAGEAAHRSMGLGVRWVLGTDGRNAPLQAAALGELDVAETTALRLREQQHAKLELARLALRHAAQQVEAARERTALLRERSQLLDHAFRAGHTALPDLLRAAQATAQADAALARQQAALGLAQAQLQQTLGILP